MTGDCRVRIDSAREEVPKPLHRSAWAATRSPTNLRALERLLKRIIKMHDALLIVVPKNGFVRRSKDSSIVGLESVQVRLCPVKVLFDNHSKRRSLRRS